MGQWSESSGFSVIESLSLFGSWGSGQSPVALVSSSLSVWFGSAWSGQSPVALVSSSLSVWFGSWGSGQSPVALVSLSLSVWFGSAWSGQSPVALVSSSLSVWFGSWAVVRVQWLKCLGSPSGTPPPPLHPLWDAVLKVCVDEGFSLSMLIGAGAFVCVCGGGGGRDWEGGLSSVGAYCLAVCMIYTSELLCDLHP